MLRPQSPRGIFFFLPNWIKKRKINSKEEQALGRYNRTTSKLSWPRINLKKNFPIPGFELPYTHISDTTPDQHLTKRFINIEISSHFSRYLNNHEPNDDQILNSLSLHQILWVFLGYGEPEIENGLSPILYFSNLAKSIWWFSLRTC